jgi:hypothetical protein
VLGSSSRSVSVRQQGAGKSSHKDGFPAPSFLLKAVRVLIVKEEIDDNAMGTAKKSKIEEDLSGKNKYIACISN